jgi:hypothetical protein
VGARRGQAGGGGGARLIGRGRRLAPAAALVVAAATLAAQGPSGNELFLRPRGFFLGPGATITLPITDGTFGGSRRAVARHRVLEASIAGPGGRRPLDLGTWTERDPRSTVRVAVGDPGTYVVGVAVGPDGAGAGSGRAWAKALLAVTEASGHLLPAAGLRATSAATRALGHDLEIVPLVDPYALGVGDTLPVAIRASGEGLAGWPVRAGGTIGTSAAPIPPQALTTSAGGRVAVRLTHDGHWFVAVQAPPAANRTSALPVSPGATLTFGLLPAGIR